MKRGCLPNQASCPLTTQLIIGLNSTELNWTEPCKVDRMLKYCYYLSPFSSLVPHRMTYNWFSKKIVTLTDYDWCGRRGTGGIKLPSDSARSGNTMEGESPSPKRICPPKQHPPYCFQSFWTHLKKKKNYNIFIQAVLCYKSYFVTVALKHRR